MVKKLSFTLLILFSFVTSLWAQKVSCSMSETEFSMQEEVQIIFTFEDIRNAPRTVNLKLQDNFSTVGGPYNSSNYSWVNGKSTSTNTISYDLVPLKSGRVKIPSYEFKVKNKIYKTEAFNVKITKSPQVEDSSEEDIPNVFLKTVLTKNEFFQGETFTIEYLLYTAENVVNYTTNPVSTLEGFIVDKFQLNSSPVSSKRIINGKEYLVASIAGLTLTPTETGEVILPVKAFRISLKKRGQSRTMFDDPFFGVSTKDINLVAPIDTINIMPLPDHAGAAFSGAIGEYAMKVSIDSLLIPENQATSLRIELTGHGNMDHFTFPSQMFGSEFEVFEPKVKDNFKLKAYDYSGKRVWEYVLIPSRPGIYKFDDILFTYLSSDKGQYITLRGEVPALKVISHNEIEGDYTSQLSPEEVRMLSKDIRFLQMEEKRTHPINEDPLKTFRPWIFFYLSALLVLCFILMELYAFYRRKNMGRIRYKHAFKNVISQFQDIDCETESPEMLAIIEGAFMQYLEDKKIRKFDYPELDDIIKTMETYKYAPGSISHAQLNELKDQCLNMIEKMEEV